MNNTPYPKTATDPLGIHGPDADANDCVYVISAGNSGTWGASIRSAGNSIIAGGLYGVVTAARSNPNVIAPQGWRVVVNSAGFYDMVPIEPEAAAPVVAITQRKPAPALPPEVHHTQAFDAERAHAATLAACRGQ